jgi:hypothetical protein
MLLPLGLLLFACHAYAEYFQFKDGQGRVYQVDANVRLEGSDTVSRVRWPDNMVTSVRVTGCGTVSGSIAFISEKTGKLLQTAPWSRGGSGMPDYIAQIVCRAR